MKTGFTDPFDGFQREGDICESCRPFWESQDLPPHKLVLLLDGHHNPVYTDNLEIPIVICPHCDGSEILRLSND